MPFFADLPQRHYDPDKAKFHLKKAGFDRLKVQINAAEVWAGAIDAATLFREHAAKGGIDLEVVRVPTDGFWTEIWLKKPFLVSWWAPRPTPDVIFSIAYSRDAEWNETRFDHDQFNKLLVAARAELDNTKRGEMYAEMQRTVRDEGGTIVPFFRNFLFARRSRLQHGPSIAGNWQLDGHKAAERWWFA
jgi:peptide/nickel transport system substrate-binding protein